MKLFDFNFIDDDINFEILFNRIDNAENSNGFIGIDELQKVNE